MFYHLKSGVVTVSLITANLLLRKLVSWSLVDQKCCQGVDNLIIPQRTGWRSYPPVVNGYMMQT